MRKKLFLIRLDDACPTMDHDKWARIEIILDRYAIKPLVGIIPMNADPKQCINDIDIFFWNKALRWKDKGWSIALHGYNHVYLSKSAGLFPFWRKSEFAGVSLGEQSEKIRRGIAIMKEHGIIPKYFFAPSHTFDINTLSALKNESEIRIISDGISLRPYWKNDFCFIPQIVGHCVNFPVRGVYTFCFHPNFMLDKDFVQLELFLIKHVEKFTTFDSLNLANYGEESSSDKILRRAFFFYRRLRGLR